MANALAQGMQAVIRVKATDHLNRMSGDAFRRSSRVSFFINSI